MSCLLETIVIEDNNPELLGIAVAILCVTYIIFAMIEIRSNNKRKARLIKTRKKIVARHDLILKENERRKKLANKINSVSSSGN